MTIKFIKTKGPKDTQQTLGRYIRDARVGKVVSQREIARDSDNFNLTPQRLNDMEHDRGDAPEHIELVYICAALDLDLWHLYKKMADDLRATIAEQDATIADMEDKLVTLNQVNVDLEDEILQRGEQ